MSLIPGTKLGPYEIVAPVSAGGMGEVYKARDTRLDRTVALKASKTEFSERFEREARAIAALNHPHICQLYDVGSNFLVMEYIEGSRLKGPLPLDQALKYAAQICDALDAAHRKGITHRDLKPANILLTKTGVKVLDFGLAKMAQTARPADDATLTMALTGKNEIIGTIHYMSPEQLQGQAGGVEIDHRSDIFSFGIVLYEMLSGKRAFEGSSTASVIAAIMEHAAPSIREIAPAALDRLVQKCLDKDPDGRWQSARDLKAELEWIARTEEEEKTAPVAAEANPRRGARFTLGVIAAALATGFALAMLWLEAPPVPGRYIPFATEPGIQTMPAWSPAGDRIAYSSEVDGVFQVFVRTIGSAAPAQITRQNASCFHPFWSVDSNRIYYIVDRRGVDQSLWSTGVAGGDAEKILDGVTEAAISPDGKTLVVIARQPDSTYGFMMSSPPGTPPRRFPQADISQMRGAVTPYFSSFRFTRDGKHLGLLTNSRAVWEFWKIPMDGSPAQMIPQQMSEVRPSFDWLPDGSIIWAGNSAGDGHLVKRDLNSGEDRAITSGVSRELYLAASPDGRTLAFQAGETGYDLIEVSLDGATPATLLSTSREEVAPSWAPDGLHFAYATNRDGSHEIRLRNRRDGSERRVAGEQDFPDKSDGLLDCAISPDGLRVAYRRSTGAGPEIWISPLGGGTPVRLYHDPRKVFQRGASWSPDGNWIAYYSAHHGKPAVMKARVGANREPELVAYAADLNPVRWSPRGDWIAWNDDNKLTLATPDGKQQRIVSRKEWLTYGWSKDGNSLYGIGVTENRRLVLGRIEIQGEREHVTADLGPMPASLQMADFQGDFSYRGFSMHPDGKSFLTSVLTIKGDIWLLEDFNRRIGWLDRLLRK